MNCRLYAQYQVAGKTVAGKKTIITTKYDKGYVVKINNERLEGQIQLKIVNGDTTEIRIKTVDGKQKISRTTLLDYGLMQFVEDLKTAKVEEKNFNAGYIVLKNGDKLSGNIALRYSMNPGESIGRNWFVRKVLFETSNGQYNTYTTKEAELIVQDVDGVKSEYMAYKDGFSKILVDGALTLVQNPYSNSQNEIANAFIDDLKTGVAKEAAKATLKNGGDLNDVVNNYDNVAGADIGVTKKEYLVKSAASSEFVVLSKENFKEWAQRQFVSCDAYQQLDKAAQKDLDDWNKIEAVIQFYNDSCR